MSVARLSSGDTSQDPKRARVELPLVMGFSDEDKIDTGSCPSRIMSVARLSSGDTS